MTTDKVFEIVYEAAREHSDETRLADLATITCKKTND